MSFDRSRTGIVSGQSQAKIAVETFELLREIPGSTFEILLRIERIGHSELRGRPGHQLHQSLGTGRRNGLAVPPRFNFDNGAKETVG